MYSTVLFKPRMQLILISARKWLAYQNVLLFLMYVVIGVASAFEPQKAAPSILYSPTNVTVIIHRTPMQIQCVTDGEPFPTVTWQHRPNSDDQWHNVRRHLAGRYRYTKSGQKLEFRKLLMSDIGFYRCVARNVLGSVHSDLAFLNIQAEAEIIELSPRTNGTVANWGTELVLRCLAVGVPAPDVTWTVDGQPLYATSVSTLPTYTRADVKVNVTHTASYECTAQNDHIEGHTVVTATTDIHVKGKNTSAASLTMEMQAEVDLSQKDLIIAVAVATATIALVLVAVAAVFCCRYCYPKLIFLPANGCTKDAKNIATKSHSIVPVDFEVDVDKLPSNAIYCQTLTDPLNVKLQTLECRRNDLKYVSDIGRGAFGQIFQASGPIPSQGISATTSVAVKVLDENDPEVEQEFLRSTLILAELSGHPNVIRLLGVCLTTRPYCIIVEYANAGDLHRFLRDSAPDHFIERWRRGGNHRDSSSEVSPHLTAVQQIDICRQIAAGMEHVAHSGFIHRDLAARNCLVFIHQHRIEIKIADFGLTRRLPLGVACYEGADAEEIAVRWTALEAVVDGRFSVASDIWSFGVTVWEVFSFASRPYGDLESTADVVRQVVTGRMLDRPDGTPEAVYDLMVACWDTDPAKRPPFTDLVSSLGVIKHRLKH